MTSNLTEARKRLVMVGCGASKGATTTSTAGTLSTMTGAFDPSDGML
jgi:hypothetical protein